MKVSYFPGCTLRTTAKEMDVYARRCAEALGVELCEIENWQCCGGVFVTARDEVASKLSSVRALAAAHAADRPLVTVCSACHNVIKQTNHAMQTDAEFADKVNRYMAQDADHPGPYHGEARVMHYLEMLRDVVGFDKLKEKVVAPLTGKKVAAYYGCLLLRPGQVMAMDDPENPTIMEDMIRAMGADAVAWSRRNECCGGYMALEDADAACKQSRRVLEDARVRGADMIVTACPLCRYNLDKHNDSGVPVVYFTDLLAQALGVKEA